MKNEISNFRSVIDNAHFRQTTIDHPTAERRTTNRNRFFYWRSASDGEWAKQGQNGALSVAGLQVSREWLPSHLVRSQPADSSIDRNEAKTSRRLCCATE